MQEALIRALENSSLFYRAMILCLILICSESLWCSAQQPTLNALTDTLPGLSQDLVQVGSGQFTITVRGFGFSSTSVVRLGTTSLATTFVDGNTLSAIIPPSLIKSVGSLSVTVIDGTNTSNALNLRVAVRADANAGGTVNIGDALVLARSAAGAVKPPLPAGIGDLNLNDSLNIGDALVLALFAGGVNANLATPVISGTNVTGSANLGDSVGITGAGFSSNAADNLVFFSQSDGTFTSSTATSVSVGSGTKTITVSVPMGAASGPIFVKRKDLGLPGQPFLLSVSNSSTPLYIRKVTAVTPLTPGSTITIDGSGFSAAASGNVIGFSNATGTSMTSPLAATTTSLTVVVPGDAVTGFVQVTVGTRVSNKKSIVISGTPTPLLINNVYYPDFAGEPVLIEGMGFIPSTPSDNQVLFSNSSGQEIAGTVVAVGRTELIALVPVGAASGTLKIKTNNGLTVSNSFNFNAASQQAASFNGRIEYAYDALNRLIEVRYPSTLIRYSYDAAGNRITMEISPKSVSSLRGIPKNEF